MTLPIRWRQKERSERENAEAGEPIRNDEHIRTEILEALASASVLTLLGLLAAWLRG